MTRRNRATLGKHFADGEMPSSEGFADLIESMLCIIDDGIDYTSPDGLRLRQIGANKLLSFYRDIDAQSAIWSVAIDKIGDSLSVGAGGHPEQWLTLAKDPRGDGPGELPPGPPRIGINQPKPAYALDVGGTVAAAGRIGSRGTRPALADGAWYTISRRYDGCTALEVTAGAGRKGAGRYAIMHAFAMNAFNSKSEITYHQAYFDSKCNRMELRWVAATDTDGEGNKVTHPDLYELQIRVGCNYGDKVWIQYHITELWFDPRMEGCSVDPVVRRLP